jgi:DNA repair exonuclease SbcCD nuclease subunit
MELLFAFTEPVLRPRFTFIHAADLHLGSPFQGLRAANPQVAATADAATYRAFDRILTLALESEAAFVLFSGDVYDAEDRNLTAQLRFRDGLRRLQRAGIRAAVIHGNHDHLGGTQARLEWPENARFFPAYPSAPEIYRLGGEPIAAVHGYSYPQRHVRESVLAHYAPRREDEGLFRIGMLHGNVGGHPDHDPYAPCSLEALGALPFDYWALGHVHGHAVLRGSGPAVVYPGSPQGLSPREVGAHGCCRVTVEPDRSVRVEFVSVHALRWTNLDVAIDELEGEDALLQRIERELDEARAGETGSVIARVRLIGRGPVHRVLRSPANVEALLRELRAGEDGEPFVWVDRLDVETRPDVDLDAHRHSPSLAGDFLRLCREARTGEALQSELLAALSEFYDRSDVRHDLPVSPEHLARWLDRAETLGADLLLGEGAE